MGISRARVCQRVGWHGEEAKSSGATINLQEDAPSLGESAKENNAPKEMAVGNSESLASVRVEARIEDLHGRGVDPAGRSDAALRVDVHIQKRAMKRGYNSRQRSGVFDADQNSECRHGA